MYNLEGVNLCCNRPNNPFNNRQSEIKITSQFVLVFFFIESCSYPTVLKVSPNLHQIEKNYNT